MPQILLSPMSISRSICSMPQSPTTIVKSLHVPMNYEALVYKLVHMMFRTSSLQISPLVNGKHMGHVSRISFGTGPHVLLHIDTLEGGKQSAVDFEDQLDPPSACSPPLHTSCTLTDPLTLSTNANKPHQSSPTAGTSTIDNQPEHSCAPTPSKSPSNKPISHPHTRYL